MIFSPRCVVARNFKFVTQMSWLVLNFFCIHMHPKCILSIETVPEMHQLPTAIGKQIHSNGIWSRKKCISLAFKLTQNAFVSESDWHFNCDFEHQSAFREHSNCAQNAFVFESNWQAHAFKWSFGAPKMHFTSIQSVPKCFCCCVGLASKCIQMVIQMVIWSTKNAFHEHSNSVRNVFVAELDWQANAYKWSFPST